SPAINHTKAAPSPEHHSSQFASFPAVTGELQSCRTVLSPEALLQSAGHWLPALAVVRAEGEESERFQAVLTEVLRRLASLHDTERPRWGELLRFVLS